MERKENTADCGRTSFTAGNRSITSQKEELMVSVIFSGVSAIHYLLPVSATLTGKRQPSGIVILVAGGLPGHYAIIVQSKNYLVLTTKLAERCAVLLNPNPFHRKQLMVKICANSLPVTDGRNDTMITPDTTGVH